MTAGWGYLKYVLLHKWFVFLACRRLRVPLWQSLVHDLSKFGRAEWGAYVRYFYGRKAEFAIGRLDPDKVDRDFDLAWNHHQKVNPHHWEHWLLWTGGTTRALPMPERYVREMLADWFGAGRAKNGSWDIEDWVVKNVGRMTFHVESADILHDTLNLELNMPRAADAVFAAHCRSAA